jgi:hypothetical protein
LARLLADDVRLEELLQLWSGATDEQRDAAMQALRSG